MSLSFFELVEIIRKIIILQLVDNPKEFIDDHILVNEEKQDTLVETYVDENGKEKRQLSSFIYKCYIFRHME